MLYPWLYNDEILYSYIARYHIWNGNTSPKATLKEVFGTINALAVVDLPCRINRLVSAGTMGVDEEGLILAATLFPYYTAFQSSIATKLALNWMLGSDSKAIHMKLGIMAGGVATPKFLRFCPKCYEADHDALGEAYWHRIHQIPGVVVCPQHGCLLENSIVNYSGVRSNEFFACNDDTCCFNGDPIILNSFEYSVAKDIANDIRWLIGNYNAVRAIYEKEGDFRQIYLFWLYQKGLATDSGRIYTAELIKSFRAYYKEKVLLLFKSTIHDENPDNWLVSIARKHRKVFHPLRHLLVMRFLCGGIQNFIESAAQSKFDFHTETIGINQVDTTDIKNHRALWLKECSKNPDKFKTDIRKEIPGVYTWLYRHDRAWLDSHSPTKNREKNRDRIDWNARDKIILEEVKACVRDLLINNERPIRVTVSTIGKRINRLGLMEKHLNKMPITKDYISKVLESQHEHRLRKIQWAIRQLEHENKEIKAWVVLKKAGIHDEMWPQYSEYIDACLYKELTSSQRFLT